MPLPGADATLGRVFALDTRQQKHHGEATQQQRVEVPPHLVLTSGPIALSFPTEDFFL